MAVVNGYATLTQVKAAARITDTVDDALLELAIESASRMIDGHCGRRFFTNGTETRYYAASDYYVLDVDDLAGTAITVATSSDLDGVYDQTWDVASDVQMEPLNRQQSGIEFPVNRLRAVGDYLFPRSTDVGVRVTGVFGFGTAVPTAVTQAAVLMAMRQYKRYDSPMGVMGWGDMGAVRVSRVDPDIQSLLAPYRRDAPGIA